MPMGKKIARRIDENVNINFEDAYRKKTGNDPTMEALKLLARQDDGPPIRIRTIESATDL